VILHAAVQQLTRFQLTQCVVQSFCDSCASCKLLHVLVSYNLILTVAGRENTGFIESDEEMVPKNKQVKKQQLDATDRYRNLHCC